MLALRMLRKTPFVTAIAVASLALGIGANAAIFSLFDQMLLRRLPVQDSNSLVNLSAPGPKPGSTNCGQAGDCEDVFSYPMLRDLEQKQQALAGVAGHVSFGASLSLNNEAFVGEGMFVSGGYFGLLGVRPAIGRLLQPSDDAVIGANYVAVLSHEFWRERFGADPKVLGKTLLVNGKSLSIVGVAQEGFRGTTLGVEPAVFVPISMRAAVTTWRPDFENRRSYWVYVFGRLKPGVTMEQAALRLNTFYRPILSDVEAPLQQGMSDATMKRFKARTIVLTEGSRGQSSIHREAKAPLLLLFAITGTVLLIACANIANLLLARGASRATEMGVRLALGATRGQLLRQLLTESLVLALIGGAVSLLVAVWTLRAIAAFMPPEALNTLDITLQPGMVLFAALLAVGTGVLFGLFPALHSTRSDLISTIRAGAGQITGGGRAATRFRTVLATAQIALSVTLLVSAGLFLKSLVNVSRAELGIDVEHVATFGISPMRTGYDSTRAKVFYERVEQELSAMPGVTDVSSSIVPLLAGNNWGRDVRVQGFESGPDVDANARYNETGAGYLKTTGMSLLAGRDFTLGDREGTAKVAIVNEAFARKFKLGANPIGKFMAGSPTDSLNIQIVGFVKDAKYSEVKGDVPPVFFVPWRQNTRVSALRFYVKTTQPPADVLRNITALMKRLDPTVPVEQIRTMPEQIRQNVFLDRMISTMATAFAVLATLLAGVGLYGVLAYSVAQRTREIGVRMALGADRARVRNLVMQQVGRMTVVGSIIGVAAAYALGRAAQSQLYEIKGHDPVVFTLALLVLVLVALSAGFLPARRAALVDPMQALRYD
jgi:predicted permease